MTNEEIIAELRQIANASLTLIEKISLAAPKPGNIRKLCWGSRVSLQFKASVIWIEEELGLNADYLMACMAFETGLEFKSNTRNPASSATGLIQFMRATALRLGTTVEQLAKMTEVEQLNYVYKYFRAFGADLSKWDLADTYMAILLPVMIGKDIESEMKWSEAAYKVNRGLDLNKDGKITKAEAAKKVQNMYDLGMRPENMG